MRRASSRRPEGKPEIASEPHGVEGYRIRLGDNGGCKGKRGRLPAARGEGGQAGMERDAASDSRERPKEPLIHINRAVGCAGSMPAAHEIMGVCAYMQPPA